MGEMAILVWAALMCLALYKLWRRAEMIEKRRQNRRDWVMARLIFEHKSGSKL